MADRKRMSRQAWEAAHRRARQKMLEGQERPKAVMQPQYRPEAVLRSERGAQKTVPFAERMKTSYINPEMRKKIRKAQELRRHRTRNKLWK